MRTSSIHLDIRKDLFDSFNFSNLGTNTNQALNDIRMSWFVRELLKTCFKRIELLWSFVWDSKMGPHKICVKNCVPRTAPMIIYQENENYKLLQKNEFVFKIYQYNSSSL